MISKDLPDEVVDLMQTLIIKLESLSSPEDECADIKINNVLGKSAAEQIYNFRIWRNKIFGSDIFGEPAWDILVDLYVQASKKKKVSITSACIASNVAATTALRWLTLLTNRGLIERESDPEDGRRVYLQLTSQCHSLMEQLLSSATVRLPAKSEAVPVARLL